jgi:hypothetical protein
MTLQDTVSETFARVRRLMAEGGLRQAAAGLDALDASTLTANAAQIHAILRERISRGLAGAPQADETPAFAAESLLKADTDVPLPGISIVSASMNREVNLLKVLPTWLDAPVDEIVIVDWASKEPLWPQLAHLRDPRLRVVRIDDEPRWVLTHAFNLGLRLARYERVYKLDADIELKPGFFELNRFSLGEFVRGYWRSAVEAGQDDQRYVNGSFGAWKKDLRAVGYYDERIQTYGWDDSDLYKRLSAGEGLAGKLLKIESLSHLAQSQLQRIESQPVRRLPLLDRFAPTEVENEINRFFTQALPEWGSYFACRDYSIEAQQLGPLVARATARPQSNLGVERWLGQVLASRMFAAWSEHALRPLDPIVIQSVHFGYVLAQLHAMGRSAHLLEALRGQRSVHIFRVAPGAWRTAFGTTLDMLMSHHDLADGPLVVIEDSGSIDTDNAGHEARRFLRAPAAILDDWVRVFKPQEQSDLATLDEVLTTKSGPNTIWNVGAEWLARNAQRNADKVCAELQGADCSVHAPIAHTVFVSSIYDDPNLLRLREYLTCVALNCRLFEKVMLTYEATDGLVSLALQQMIELGAIPKRSVQLMPFRDRPSFAHLFDSSKICPPGTLVAVGNADVFFDNSLKLLADVLTDDMVCAISRRDIVPDGRSARLIRLENGCPNTFSADAWVARTPFEPDFFLDYAIGSFHCDSFINNQFSRSRRYRPANPCLDVRVFHLHDERFNSSQAKWLRDREKIEARRVEEQARNDGEEPLKGLSWCRISDLDLMAGPESALTWRPRAIVLDRSAVLLSFTDVLFLHVLALALKRHWDLVVVLRLSRSQIESPVIRVVARLRAHFGHWTILFDEDDSDGIQSDPRVRQVDLDTSELATALVAHGLAGVDSLVQRSAGWLEHNVHDKIVGTFADGLDDHSAQQLFRDLRNHQPELMEAFAAWADSTDPWSAEGRVMRPHWQTLRASPLSPLPDGNLPSVTFVTSMFRGGAFVSGYLSNVLAAAIEANGEVVLMDANLGDHDAPAVEAFLRQHEQARRRIRWIRLDRDPGLYACWKLAIEQSRSTLVTNANLDDRRSPDHTRRIVELLGWRKDIAAASGRISAVREQAEGGWFDLLPNELWFEDMELSEYGDEALYLVDADGQVRSRNVLHCMPVWRRSLHDHVGWFDEEMYGTSADWAFWLKVGREGGRFAFVPEAYGRYLINADSHNRRNDADGAKERRIIAELIGVHQSRVIKQ